LIARSSFITSGTGGNGWVAPVTNHSASKVIEEPI